MKMKHSVKKSTLTALVCLALSSSALAMPANGTVADGTVQIDGTETAVGKTIPTVASGALISAVNGNSIINWGSFGIAAGETLTFNTEKGAILNRVTGSDPTAIYGTLTQTGAYPLFVVNPNGITVGNGATIDAECLVMSTLAVTDADFNAYANNLATNFTTPEGKDVAAAIKIEKTNKIDISNYIDLIGGTINIDDNVSISSTTSNINAANSLTETMGEITNFAASPINTVSITNSTVEVKGFTTIHAGKVLVENSNLDNQTLMVYAANTTSMDDNGLLFEAKNTNSVTINNSKLTGNSIAVEAGSVALNGTTVELADIGDGETKKDASFVVMAYNKSGYKDGKEIEEIGDSTKTMDKSTTIIGLSDEAKEWLMEGFTITDSSSGKQAMGELLEKNATTAGRVQAAGALVQNLNTADGTSRAKAGQVLGMLNNIESNQALGAPERNAMRHAILDNYAPVRSGEQLNESTRTAAHTEAELSTIERLVDALVAAATSDDEAVVTVER